MSGPWIPLGDSHNFGRRVERRGDRIHKPRTVVWERFLLDAGSPLRRLLAAAAVRDGLGSEAFSFLPDLRFHPSAEEEVGGEVESLHLEPLVELDEAGRIALARVAGRSLALWSWLGVSDLHWENLVLGTDSGGRIVFAPLDVESLLDPLALPTETKLLPDADPEYAEICRHACGLRRLLPYLGKPIAVASLLEIVAAYRATLAFLDRHGDEIGALFLALPGLGEAPIRVCLRSTGDYLRAATERVWPPLLAAEEEQMARGDVPYFFRFYGRSGIFYYADPALATLGRLPARGDVPRLGPLLDLSRGLAAPARPTLPDEGSIAIVGAFDHPTYRGHHRGRALELTFRRRSLTLRLPSGEELESDRDLSAWVGSVYLPCRCGEVRTVFVPAVTVCEPRAGES